MTIPILSGPPGLYEFAELCAQQLFNIEPHQFVFPAICSPHNWPVNEIKRANEEFLKSLRHRANVYALSVRTTGSDEKWQVVYVGERKSIGLRDRITQHLIIKSDQTGSMLAEVKNAVSEQQDIGVSLIKVFPESLRLFVEEAIIAKHKSDLPWNTHG